MGEVELGRSKLRPAIAGAGEAVLEDRRESKTEVAGKQTVPKLAVEVGVRGRRYGVKGAWVILSSVRGLKTTSERQKLAQSSLQRTDDRDESRKGSW